MTDPRNDYLWDPSAPPDPEIQKLERALGALRYTGDAPEAETPAPHVERRSRWLLVAAAGIAVAASFFALTQLGPEGATGAATWTYKLTTDGGGLRDGTLRVGEWLETDEETVAELEVADIGWLTLDPRTRIKLLATGANQHRIRLARGRLQAVVDAPPELFIAETPAATAVDMGCAYELVVDDAGSGFLRVTSGLVELRRPGRRAVVPAGALCEARDEGLGTPRFETATPTLRLALRQIDFGEGATNALGDVLGSATERDTLTLWHLLQDPRFERDARIRILEVLTSFTDMPMEATREGTLALDPLMLDAWYETLELYW